MAARRLTPAVVGRFAVYLVATLALASRAAAVDWQRFEAVRNAPSAAAAAATDRVALRALQSFAGPTLVGANGPMARAGLDLALLYQEYSDYVANGRPGPFATSLVGIRI